MERAVHLDGEVVSWEMLPLLGVRPELGHGFRPEDEKLGGDARSCWLIHIRVASR